MTDSSNRIIALITDFGIRGSHYVASMKGVISNIAQNSKIIDVSHTITPFSIIEAAYIIRTTYQLFPKNSIFVFVIDPGVGSERNIVILRTKDNYYFVGPDNGILPNALKSEISECFKVQNDDFFYHPVSNTFHGRDIMAPCGAHIANDVPLEKFGPSFDPENLMRFKIPLDFNKKEKSIRFTIQYTDSFGNITSNIPLDENNYIDNFSRKLTPGIKIEFTINNQNYKGTFTTHFSNVKKNEILFLKGSTGYLEISKNQSNLADELQVHSGNQIKLKFP